MNSNDKKLIEMMESKYDDFKPKLDRLKEDLVDFQNSYSDYVELKNFYGSDDWFRLSKNPFEGIKCGVLSEDQLFDFIGDHNELLANFLDLSSRMYKNM
ncbi:UNVERIFIED_CONTAM: DUF4298 domain-containing protein [Streptococcus canis]